MATASTSATTATESKPPGMMNVERLTAMREAKSDAPLAMEVATLLARYEQVQTAVVCDVLREHCLINQAFPGHLLALRPQRARRPERSSRPRRRSRPLATLCGSSRGMSASLPPATCF